MNPKDCIHCEHFPCVDVRHDQYLIPDLQFDPKKVSIVMISEAAPENFDDGYYAGPDALFAQTTLLAFQDAYAPVEYFQDILDLGVYLTTAVKCGKTGYGIATETVQECSKILEQELALFPKARVYLLMGDVAIKAINAIAKRNKEPRPIPAGATYKIRGGDFRFKGVRLFPSYLQAGPSFFIEKSKRHMIAEDIANALRGL